MDIPNIIISKIEGYFKLGQEEVFENSSDEQVGQMLQGFTMSETSEFGLFAKDEEEEEDDYRLCDLENKNPNPAVLPLEQLHKGEIDYCNPACDELTTRQKLILSIYSIYVRYQTQRRYKNEIHQVYLLANISTIDYQTVEKLIGNIIGVQPIVYDCYINSYMSYNIFPDLIECLHCRQLRYKEQALQVVIKKTCKDDIIKVLQAAHEILDIFHTLQLIYSDPLTAQTLNNYWDFV